MHFPPKSALFVLTETRTSLRLWQDPHDLVPAEVNCFTTRPGLSSYAKNPMAAGASLKSLFDHAISLGVPQGKLDVRMMD